MAAESLPAADATGAVAETTAAPLTVPVEHGTERDAKAVSPPSAPAAAPVAVGGMRRSDQLVLGVLATTALILMAVHWARLSGWGVREIEINRLPDRTFEYRLDINTATWVEWMQIEAIGETLARRIVEDRERNGPFANVDDLCRVKGIGAKTLERIRPTLTVGPSAEAPASSDSPRE